MQKPHILVQGFQMRFGSTVVIDDLSFEVNHGETFGFLGSNGSGKTTTIRALLGIYRPFAGTLLIDGKPFSPASGNSLGYLPEERGLYKKENVLDTMIYFGRLKGLTSTLARTWSLAYLERVGLADKATTILSTLSGGQQQKVQLGVTIMNEPQLLILDEPTKGFDPVNRRLMMEIIEERKAAGATVILVTHQMEEVERLCDRILLLKDGKRRLYGTVSEVLHEGGEDLIHIEYSGTFQTEGPWTVVQSGHGVADLHLVEGTTNRTALAALSSQHDLDLLSYAVKRPSLDDLFVKIYEEDHHA